MISLQQSWNDINSESISNDHSKLIFVHDYFESEEILIHQYLINDDSSQQSLNLTTDVEKGLIIVTIPIFNGIMTFDPGLLLFSFDVIICFQFLINIASFCIQI